MPRRQRYDQYGHAGASASHDYSHMEPADIFSMFEDIFGGFGGNGAKASKGATRGATRGFDLEVQVELTLGEVATGAEKTIELRSRIAANLQGDGCKTGQFTDGLRSMRRARAGGAAGIWRHVPHGRQLPQLPGPRHSGQRPLPQLRCGSGPASS